MNDAAVKLLSSLHTTLYRLTGGVVGHRLVANDMLLLTTTGRTTRRQHTVPLLFLRNGSDLVVIASFGGRGHDPEWYRNLVDHPEATVQIDRDTLSVVARTMAGEERATWWTRVTAAYDGYAEYQARTDREIPIVALRPV